jgi:hypothetical protein
MMELTPSHDNLFLQFSPSTKVVISVLIILYTRCPQISVYHPQISVYHAAKSSSKPSGRLVIGILIGMFTTPALPSC